MNNLLPPVLVVDDEKNMRISLKSILAGRGLHDARGGVGGGGIGAAGKRGVFHGHHRRPPGRDERV